MSTFRQSSMPEVFLRAPDATEPKGCTSIAPLLAMAMLFDLLGLFIIDPRDCGSVPIQALSLEDHPKNCVSQQDQERSGTRGQCAN
ncbi:hypothetical protein [Mesorhizobium sp.]|uniref:hypothetical protein n=1 Tax=Mesorhizobium sp. TaxID=1871066 RepID=UPI001674A2F5|nr:hypothetical protein [Mesorhizobium sp.]